MNTAEGPRFDYELEEAMDDYELEEPDDAMVAAIDAGAEADGQSAQRRIRHYTRTIWICTVVLVVLALLLIAILWAIAGLSMRAGLLPYFDLGYGWFDQTIFLFFGLS